MSKSKKIYSFFLLFVSVLFFAYTYYRSEIFNAGLFRSNYLFYYFFSLILIFLSIISVYLSKKININFLIIIISIFFALYLVELYFIFLNSKKKQDFNTQGLWQFYLDQKKNKNIAITLGPSYYVANLPNEDLLPLSGISNTETIFCNESGNYAFYKSDRFGFNNPDYEWDKNFFEYFIVGDSFAHGACVERPFDISSVLRLQNNNVINLGFGGNGPLAEYATLREYLKPNVKKILWFYYEENDLDDLKKELKSKILLNYFTNLDFSQNLLQKQNLIDNIYRHEETQIENRNYFQININTNNKKKNNIANFLKLYETRRLFFLTYTFLASEKKVSKDFEKILFLANQLAIQNESKLYFVYLPRYSRYVVNYGQPNIDNLKIIVEKLGIEFIDIDKEVFKKESDPLNLFPFRKYNHYNELGYSKIANVIHQLTR